MDTAVQDLRFALRTLRAQRSTTLIALLCLALGIGANTAIFSVVRGVLLGALPYRAPDRLVRLYEMRTRQGVRDRFPASVPNYRDVRAESRVFAGVAAYAAGAPTLGGAGDPLRLRVVRGTANLFGVLGAAPLLGRTFAPDEDTDGAPPVVVLSERLWRDRFAADRRILGQRIALDGVPYTVIGVMPGTFEFPITADHSDAWVPLPFPPTRQNGDRTSYWLGIVARLRPGVTLAAAAADVDGIMGRIRRQEPAVGDLGALVRPLHEDVVGAVRPALLILLGAVALVLLIACANVANLLLARAESRRREVAVRLALGAERRRLVRQFLTESIVLGAMGGVLGVGLAAVGLRGLVALAGRTLPRGDTVSLDASVLLFALALSLVTGIVFGTIPALRATRTEPRRDLGGAAGRASAGRAQRRVLGALVVGEIAVAFMLLVGAGLLVRSLARVLSTDAGLDPRGVLTLRTGVAEDRYAPAARYAAFYQPVLERLRALPGVRAAAMTSALPLRGFDQNGTFRIEGRPVDPDPTHQPFAEFRVVSDGYFRTLRIPVLAGREFGPRDVAGAPRVVLVNEEFARRYFPHETALGHRLFPWDTAASTIVGVVRSVRQAGLDRDARAEVYVPAAQASRRLFGVTYVVAAGGDPSRLTAAARRAVAQVAADAPVYDVAPMERVASDSIGGRRLLVVLLSLFAALALALSAAGTYGVVSYGVTRRTHEIGIRIALGAQRTAVGRMVVGDALALTLGGVALGAAAAAVLTRVLQSILYGVGARDPVTFVGVGGALVVVALVAGLVPALRAVRVAPSQALRDG